jgi:hypothetical protein
MGGGSSGTNFPLRRGKPFAGILDHLTTEYHNNPQTAGLIELTSSPVGARCLTKIEDILVAHTTGEWCSVNEPDAFVNVHFTRFTVLLSGYTLQTFPGRKGTTHLRSWKLEGSADGYDWVELDNVEPCEDLNEPNAIISRPVAKADYFSDFRLTQLAANHFGTQCLTIQRIELFGEYRCTPSQ